MEMAVLRTLGGWCAESFPISSRGSSHVTASAECLYEKQIDETRARKVPLNGMLSQCAQQCYLLQAAKFYFFALASLANGMKHATTCPQESKTARKLPKVFAA